MKHELPETEPVVLHEIFGMRPGKAIFIGLIIAAVLIIFLICFLPGILKGGRYVSFSSAYSSVGIISDGKYIGSTDGTRFFISSGEHQLTYIKDGETVGTESIKVDHPVFFTLFVRRTLDHEISISPSAEIIERAYERALSDAVLYSAVTDYDEFYNYRPFFTYFAMDAVANSESNVSDKLFTLASFVTSEVMYQDLQSAISLLEENNVSYSSSELSALLSEIPEILSENGTWSFNAVNGRQVPHTDGTWYDYTADEITIGKSSPVSVAGAATMPLEVETEAFEINGHMVSEYEYALFAEANPYWAKSNIDTLVTDGMADEHYLDGIYLTTATRSERPVRNISWYAAKAYTEWLSENDSEYEYFLPSEAQFEVVALSTASKSYQTSLISTDTDTTLPSSVMGGLWEFTSTHYVPLARLTDKYSELVKTEEADIIIKGGSYINSSVTAADTGIMAKDSTSEYAGIRVARRAR